jgi:YfiH family protein
MVPLVTEALQFSDPQFPFLKPLNAIPGVRATWIPRLTPLASSSTAVERDEAMRVLRPHHERIARTFADGAVWWRAEQVHGNDVAVVPGAQTVPAADGLSHVPGVDGLVTATPRTLLSIYVADCAAIWLADRESTAIGLVHSGKKGTAGNILAVALKHMAERFGSAPANIVAVLSPCIRPPHYEVDFAAQIAKQAEAAKIGEFHDCGEDTARDLSRHYSYRMELGKTGRMMAMIVRDPT